MRMKSLTLVAVLMVLPAMACEVHVGDGSRQPAASPNGAAPPIAPPPAPPAPRAPAPAATPATPAYTPTGTMHAADGGATP